MTEAEVRSAIHLLLPWPSRLLSSNVRCHWSTRAKETRNARWLAKCLSNEARVPRGIGATLRFTYRPPDRRRRDAQNMPAMLKAYIDGIADHVGCDDGEFNCIFPPGFGEVEKGGSILVCIEVNK